MQSINAMNQCKLTLFHSINRGAPLHNTNININNNTNTIYTNTNTIYTNINMFAHDITNLEAYPFVSVCIDTMAFWWLLPLLSTVSKGLRSSLNTSAYKRAALKALKVRVACKLFALKGEQLKLKMSVIKHLWVLWNKPGNKDDEVSSAMATMLQALQATKHFNRICKEQATFLGLSLLGWDPLFAIVIRLAIWMHHFGMQNTTLYMVFIARMDLLFIELARSYPYVSKQQPRFSKYIEQIISKDSHKIWIWSVVEHPRGCAVYDEMHSLWAHAKRGVHQMYFNQLPPFIQNVIALLAAYQVFYKKRSTSISPKLARIEDMYMECTMGM